MLLATGVLTACGGTAGSGRATTASSSLVERVSGGPTGIYVVEKGINKMKHVIVVMQEKRSFDSYFGTFPGAAGIPMSAGGPTPCVPSPATTGQIGRAH